MCVRGHSSENTKVTEDGRRLCLSCRDELLSRKSAAYRRNVHRRSVRRDALPNRSPYASQPTRT